MAERTRGMGRGLAAILSSAQADVEVEAALAETFEAAYGDSGSGSMVSTLGSCRPSIPAITSS